MSQLETLFTDAWQKQSAWLWLLLPLSWLYRLIITLRHWLYQQGWLKSYRAPIPIMVIGNISVGGSGKTPLIIALVEHLQQQGVAVGVISRGYGGDTTQMPALVTSDSTPKQVGDEPCLIVASTQVPMSVCPNRQQAIEQLLQHHPKLQLIIADDGLQHYALQRDIEWIVVDASRGFGNQQLLPTGFLREPVSRLKHSTVIYHTVNPHGVDAASVNKKLSQIPQSTPKPKQMWLQPAAVKQLLPSSRMRQLDENLVKKPVENIDHSAPKLGDTVYAVTGIGYPKRFFDTLRQQGYKVIEKPFSDHHVFVAEELLCLDQHPIMVTSKDAVKIRVLAQSNPQIAALPIWVLPVSAQLTEACYMTLKQQLNTLGIVY